MRSGPGWLSLRIPFYYFPRLSLLVTDPHPFRDGASLRADTKGEMLRTPGDDTNTSLLQLDERGKQTQRYRHARKRTNNRERANPGKRHKHEIEGKLLPACVHQNIRWRKAQETTLTCFTLMPPFISAMKSAISWGTSCRTADAATVQPMVLLQLRNAAPMVTPSAKLCT